MPVSTLSCHLNIHGTVSESFPESAIFHLDIDRAERSLCHSIAYCIRIITYPVRIFVFQSDINLPLGSHTTISDDITFNNCPVLADIEIRYFVDFNRAAHSGSIFIHIGTVCSIYVHNAIIRRSKFSICTDSRPSSIDSLNRTTADIDI